MCYYVLYSRRIARVVKWQYKENVEVGLYVRPVDVDTVTVNYDGTET